MNLPQDPFILFSYINMNLRDSGLDFWEFCRERDVDPQEISDRLQSVGFEYDKATNSFK